MALALAVVLALITLISMVLFAGHYWWFPVLASQHGAAIDEQIVRTFWLCGVIFFCAQMGLAWAIYRYRSRGGRGHYSHGNNTLEGVWTVATAVLFIGVNLLGQKVWAERFLTRAGPGALQIEVTGQQFVWNIRYPGPDGKFGRTDVKFVDDSAGNPLGVDPKDPDGKDDITVPTMAVPVNRQVEVILRSKDVTHAFFVRELRMKQDTVPGLSIRIHFIPTRIGQYEIACAELCGLGHYKMRSFLDVLSEQDFEKWLKERAPQQ